MHHSNLCGICDRENTFIVSSSGILLEHILNLTNTVFGQIPNDLNHLVLIQSAGLGLTVWHPLDEIDGSLALSCQ